MTYTPTWKQAMRSRELCGKCHKMLVVKADGSLPGHKCLPASAVPNGLPNSVCGPSAPEAEEEQEPIRLGGPETLAFFDRLNPKDGPCRRCGRTALGQGVNVGAQGLCPGCRAPAGRACRHGQIGDCAICIVASGPEAERCESEACGRCQGCVEKERGL